MQFPKKLIALVGLGLLVIFAINLVLIPYVGRKIARRYNERRLSEIPSVIPVNEWKKFSSTEEKFSIWFPGDPELTNVITSFSNVDLSVPCFFIWNRQTEYAVDCIQYPKNIIKFPPKQEFDIFQIGITNGIGKIVYQKDITIEGYPARDLEYTAVGNVSYVGRIRMVLVDERLYMLMIVFLPQNPHPADRDVFFNSFRLQK